MSSFINWLSLSGIELYCGGRQRQLWNSPWTIWIHASVSLRDWNSRKLTAIYIKKKRGKKRLGVNNHVQHPKKLNKIKWNSQVVKTNYIEKFQIMTAVCLCKWPYCRLGRLDTEHKGTVAYPELILGIQGRQLRTAQWNGSDSQQICACPLHPQSFPLSPSLAGWEKGGNLKWRKRSLFPPI